MDVKLQGNYGVTQGSALGPLFHAIKYENFKIIYFGKNNPRILYRHRERTHHYRP